MALKEITIKKVTPMVSAKGKPYVSILTDKGAQFLNFTNDPKWMDLVDHRVTVEYDTFPGGDGKTLLKVYSVKASVKIDAGNGDTGPSLPPPNPAEVPFAETDLEAKVDTLTHMADVILNDVKNSMNMMDDILKILKAHFK